jgi:multiple sugar transport system substrate-binding protein
MKRTSIPVSLLAALSLVLAACGPSGGTTVPGTTGAPGTSAPVATTAGPTSTTQPTGSLAPSGSPSAAECPESAQGQTIDMWSPFTGPDGVFMTDLAAKFSSENTRGITVNHVAQPDYMLSLNNAASSPADLPEMIAVRVINVGELAARHILQPYSDEALAIVGDEVASDIPDNLWVRGEYNGKRYSIALDTHMLVMYYNKEMFAAAGVTEPAAGTPWTAAEFDDALAKLKTSGVEPIAVGDGFNAATLFQTFIVQFGGALANEEGTQATFNSDAGVQALEYVAALRAKGAPGISGAGDPEVNVFKQKGAAIVIHGPWHISGMEALTDIDVGYAPVPQAGSVYGVWAGSHQLALVSSDPAAQAASACWVRWLSDNSIGWAAAGQFPARGSVRSDPELATKAFPISRVAAVVDKAIILPQVAGLEGALWGSGFGPVVDQVMAGELTGTDAIKAALDTAQAQSQQVIDANAVQYAASPTP